MSEKYQKLKELLLEQENFPLQYPIKLIGTNDGKFMTAIDSLIAERPELSKHGVKMSSEARHVSVTLILSAKSADHVVETLLILETIDGLRTLF